MSQPQMNGSFTRPTTDEGWKAFHTANEEGMSRAYAAKEGYFKDGSKLYVAGTRTFSDVLDWPKIPLGKFQDSGIYKNVEPVFRANPEITEVIGHSAGGSAALELERRFPERKVTSVTYNAPVLSRADPKVWFPRKGEDSQPLRFATAGDPVSLFDQNAQVAFKAPQFDVGAIKNLAQLYTAPSLDAAAKVVKSGLPDPLSGLHRLTGTYSDPSGPMDFVKSAVEGVAVGTALGVL